jgi:hypothetical protein
MRADSTSTDPRCAEVSRRTSPNITSRSKKTEWLTLTGRIERIYLLIIPSWLRPAATPPRRTSHEELFHRIAPLAMSKGANLFGGFQHVAGFGRRHVGASIQTAWTASMDAVRAALDADTANDRALLLRSISQELGGTRDAVMETAVSRLDISQKQAAEAYTLAEEHETNPRSVRGYVQRLTRLSARPGRTDDPPSIAPPVAS